MAVYDNNVKRNLYHQRTGVYPFVDPTRLYELTTTSASTTVYSDKPLLLFLNSIDKIDLLGNFKEHLKKHSSKYQPTITNLELKIAELQLESILNLGNNRETNSLDKIRRLERGIQAINDMIYESASSAFDKEFKEFIKDLPLGLSKKIFPLGFSINENTKAHYDIAQIIANKIEWGRVNGNRLQFSYLSQNRGINGAFERVIDSHMYSLNTRQVLSEFKTRMNELKNLNLADTQIETLLSYKYELSKLGDHTIQFYDSWMNFESKFIEIAKSKTIQTESLLTMFMTYQEGLKYTGNRLPHVSYIISQIKTYELHIFNMAFTEFHSSIKSTFPIAETIPIADMKAESIETTIKFVESLNKLVVSGFSLDLITSIDKEKLLELGQKSEVELRTIATTSVNLKKFKLMTLTKDFKDNRILQLNRKLFSNSLVEKYPSTYKDYTRSKMKDYGIKTKAFAKKIMRIRK